MFYALVTDNNGNGVGCHSYTEEPVAYGNNEVPCTADQAQNPTLWSNANGVLTKSLPAVKAAQIALVSAACAQAITVGFSSSALGAAYAYPSTLTDQSNQQTVAQSSTGGALWCESSGVWALKQHTQAQAQTVVADFAVWLNKCQQQLVTLSADVDAATSVSAVQAVVWTNPT